MILVGIRPREVCEFVYKAMDEGCISGLWLRGSYFSQEGQFLLPFHDFHFHKLILYLGTVAPVR